MGPPYGLGRTRSNPILSTAHTTSDNNCQPSVITKPFVDNLHSSAPSISSMTVNSKNKSHDNVGVDNESIAQSTELKSEIQKKNRFIIEPVHNLNTYRLKNLVKRSHSHVPLRARRNAVSSTMATSCERENEEYLSRANSEASTPTRTISLVDGKGFLSYDHQNSISRNISEYVKQAKRRLKYKKEADNKIEYDLFGDERREWEMIRLKEKIEFDEKHIDPAPFQLVRRTSVYKVHSLFSLLDLNRAYVTDRGRLVGVVALRDLRIAIENSQNGISLKATELNKNDVESGERVKTSDDSPSNNRSIYVSTNKANDGNVTPTNVENVHEKAIIPTPQFFEKLERKRRESLQPDPNAAEDLLTPTLKVVHPSSSSLHHISSPVLTCIHEENEPDSLKSSLKHKSATTTATISTSLNEEVTNLLPQVSPTTELLSQAASVLAATAERLENQFGSEMEILPTIKTANSESLQLPVAKAVEYLRRKSLGADELKVLGVFKE